MAAREHPASAPPQLPNRSTVPLATIDPNPRIPLDDQTLTLLNRAREEDAQAIGELFERYREPLRRALRRMVGEDYRVRIADSEDAAHDAILSALQDLGSFEYRGDGSFLAWLLKRAEHALLNKVRASRRFRRDPGPGRLQPLEEGLDAFDGEISVSEQARARERQDVLRSALEELPPKERDVILLRQFMELDTQSICEEMSLATPSAARNLYARAQARLAVILARQGFHQDNL